MDELIFRVLGGHATAAEEEQLRRWRAESLDNEAHFRRASGVWSLTEPAGWGEVPPPPGVDAVVRAWEQQRAEAGTSATVRSLEERRGKAAPRLNALRWSLALAAGLAAVALGIRLVGMPGRGPELLALYEGGAAHPSTFILSDGSRVRLAPGSRLQRWVAEGERLSNLKGRAFFAVAHDPQRPFVVRADGAEARVLGTRFELSSSDEGLRAVVVDGRLSVSNELGQVEVSGGSVGYALAGQAPTSESPGDIYALLDWPGGLLVFHATPLGRVAEEVGRQFGRTLEVIGDSLRALRISASFEEEGFEEIVQALCEVAAADCALTDEGASIGSRN